MFEVVQSLYASAVTPFFPISVCPGLSFKCHDSDTAPHSQYEKTITRAAGIIRIERLLKAAIK